MSIIPQKLNWQPEFSVHVKELDEQHKHLIDGINDLIDCLNRSASSDQITKAIDLIKSKEEAHFTTEEKYFKQYDYPKASEHIEAHRHFSARCQELEQQYKNDPVLYATNFVYLLEEWWVAHIKGMDHQYADFFNQHGLY